MVAVAIGDCALVTTGEAIQAVIAIGLLVDRQGGSRGRCHTVIATRGRPRVARPRQAAERVITEGLTLRQGPTADGGHGGGCPQNIADVVIREGLAPEGHAVARSTAGERPLNAVIAEGSRKDWRGRSTGLGTRTTNGHARERSPGVVARLPHQEIHWIG